MIRIAGIRKEFPGKRGPFRALADLDLEVAAKEFFVLLGPSGSGKTTLLRCVAGIESPDRGEIYLDDRLIFSASRNINVRPEERGLGMVFQSYAVWPHMTVYQNVALPLTHGARRIPRAKVRDRVMETLALVQMEDFADRPVPLLSGGQQQRVALARALAVQPVVLLMDEPLSNLDARLREEVRSQIKEVTNSVGVTVLYVTHDQTEAAALADRIAVMSEGRILQIAGPDELYRRPADPAVAEFLGRMNWLQGTIRDTDRIETEIGVLEAKTGGLRGPVRIGLRPADIAISRTASGRSNEFEGHVSEEVFLGEQVQLRVSLQQGRSIDVKLSNQFRDRLTGKSVYFRCAADDVLVFPNQ
jgi:iron(III) transport system ATP-binding protein